MTDRDEVVILRGSHAARYLAGVDPEDDPEGDSDPEDDPEDDSDPEDDPEDDEFEDEEGTRWRKVKPKPAKKAARPVKKAPAKKAAPTRKRSAGDRYFGSR